MKCFARWGRDNETDVFFRDQTILKFGNSWDLLASFILLNPGSALPLNNESKTDFLRSKELPFFIEPEVGERYVEFSIDRLMYDIVKLFSSDFAGGTIKLYNLFNLRNQFSGEAVEQLNNNMRHPKMFSADSEIIFCNAPVIVASGRNAKHPELKKQLIKYIQLAPAENLFALCKKESKKFQIQAAEIDASGFVDSYHPSYTFKYGNSTDIGEIRT